jgi:hypothetical protein
MLVAFLRGQDVGPLIAAPSPVLIGTEELQFSAIRVVRPVAPEKAISYPDWGTTRCACVLIKFPAHCLVTFPIGILRIIFILIHTLK